MLRNYGATTLLTFLIALLTACSHAVPIATRGRLFATTLAPVRTEFPAVREADDLETLLRKNPRLGPALDRASATRLQILVSVPKRDGGWESRKDDLQDLLVSVVRPDLRDDNAVPQLGDEEREVLLSALSAFPSDRAWGTTDDTEEKPLVAGALRVVPHERLTIASKSGRAYGFVVDNAYVRDQRTGRSFFVTVAMYANEDGRMNDNAYDWNRALPILSDIGETVARRVFGDPDK
jgi:hypothetical protein